MGFIQLPEEVGLGEAPKEFFLWNFWNSPVFFHNKRLEKGQATTPDDYHGLLLQVSDKYHFLYGLTAKNIAENFTH